MQEDPLKALNLRVVIALGCLRRTTVRGFAGCGRSRRRDMHLIPAMAEEIARGLNASLRFEREGRPVIRSRVARHISEVLQEVTDAEARAWAGIDATATRTARHGIAARITGRLAGRYRVVLTPHPVIVPATNVWCGLEEAERE